MCRWLAYLGAPVFLEDFIAKPCQSMIAQSRHCREAKSEVNADGFGIGWYGDRERPGLFRDVRPAWSDENLLSIAHQIRSSLFLAHVRAATGTATIRNNCHPFAADRYLFMHNGQIGGFEKIRRTLENSLSDAVFDQREGTTDSELFFLLMIDEGLSDDPQGAVSRATSRVVDASRRAGIEPALKLTAAFSDGVSLYAVRYASDNHAPTLYTSTFGKGTGGCIVSEPFDRDGGEWQAIPPSSFVTMTKTGMTIRPFVPVAAKLALVG